MSNSELFYLIVLSAFYAPLIITCLGKKPGGGAWKFLTFLLCTVSLAAPIFAWPLALAWLLAWFTAAAAISSARKQSTADAILTTLREQNQLLRKAHTQ